MTPNKLKIINKIKNDFPLIYEQLDPEKKLNEEQLWKQIDKIIKESQKYHCGMDLSGLVNVLSTIKNGYKREESVLRFDMYYYNVYNESFKSYKKLKCLIN